MNDQINPAETSLPTTPGTAAKLQSLPADAGPGLILDSLLKRPMQLIRMLCGTGSSRHWFLLLLVGVFTFALYGVVMGSFAGGEQYLITPLKVSIGGLLSILICFPSFYIFACLSGVEVSLRGLAGVVFAMFALAGLLLLGFVPVAWVFSQSTESVNFIGSLHLAIWAIATLFSLKLLRHMTQALGVPNHINLKIWAMIYILVSLQMTTTLRPILSPSKDLLPKEKKFFLAYWFENISSDIPKDLAP